MGRGPGSCIGAPAGVERGPWILCPARALLTHRRCCVTMGPERLRVIHRRGPACERSRTGPQSLPGSAHELTPPAQASGERRAPHAWNAAAPGHHQRSRATAPGAHVPGRGSGIRRTAPQRPALGRAGAALRRPLPLTRSRTRVRAGRGRMRNRSPRRLGERSRLRSSNLWHDQRKLEAPSVRGVGLGSLSPSGIPWERKRGAPPAGTCPSPLATHAGACTASARGNPSPTSGSRIGSNPAKCPQA